MTKNATRGRLGLVLGGTGVRGLAQAGSLAALERAGFAPDVLVGVSTGSIVASAYAARSDWSDALRSVDRGKLPALASPAPDDDMLARLRTTLRSARQLAPSVWTWGRQGYDEFGRTVLGELVGRGLRIEAARVPTALVATDLLRGERVVLESGLLCDAALAASALPGITKPVEIDGTLLADGGFSDPAPVDVARNLGATAVVVPHCFSPGKPHEADNWLLALVRGMEIGQQAFTEERLAHADLVVPVELGETMRSLDFNSIDAASKAAAAAISAHLPAIRRMLERH